MNKYKIGDTLYPKTGGKIRVQEIVCKHGAIYYGEEPIKKGVVMRYFKQDDLSLKPKNMKISKSLDQYIEAPWYKCPWCGKKKIITSFTYCPDCGEKIKWEE